MEDIEFSYYPDSKEGCHFTLHRLSSQAFPRKPSRKSLPQGLRLQGKLLMHYLTDKPHDLGQRHNLIDYRLHRYCLKPLKVTFDNALRPKLLPSRTKLISFLNENENLIKQPTDATSSSGSDPDFSPSPRPQTYGLRPSFSPSPKPQIYGLRPIFSPSPRPQTYGLRPSISPSPRPQTYGLRPSRGSIPKTLISSRTDTHCFIDDTRDIEPK
ncbi:hypothetical protein AVEN_60475-1 [Araneus ventricosus]|uniref:Uncharacterized protein n=1 Tax=Araneus ventricosus TaxID=182803 RepID=A0A4Y2N852_ARAVE|nr:hypothetical protein AVEN_60475-1 [Araneus ventricosus]